VAGGGDEWPDVRRLAVRDGRRFFSGDVRRRFAGDSGDCGKRFSR
jgi:hypothetical protein